MNSENLDRKRTQTIKGKIVNFTLHEPSTISPPLEKVTSVAVVPFDNQGNIVATLLERGIDIPGGHMHKNEKSFEETARREALEESFITLGPLETIYVIESDYYGTKKDELSYMIVMVGLVNTFEEEEDNGESFGRKIVSVDQFIKDYSAVEGDFMKDIILKAQQFHKEKLNPQKKIPQKAPHLK